MASRLCVLYMIVSVALIDVTISSVIRVSISSAGPLELSCKHGYFVYKIPPGIYRNDDGSDQSIYPGAMCRSCAICPDGAATLSPCSPTTDTVCGGCLQQGYVFDEGTKSCQPEYIIQGQAGPEKHLGLNELDETASVNAPYLVEDGDGEDISATSVETLFIGAATLFTVVATTAVVLVIIACVACSCKFKQRRSKLGKDTKDKPATSKEKKGEVNVNFMGNNEETVVCPLYTVDGDSMPTFKKGGDEKPWNSLLDGERTHKLS